MIVAKIHYADRKTAHLRGELFRLTFIGTDGSVSLTQLDVKGAPSTHIIQKDLAEFIKNYKKCPADMKSPKMSSLPEFIGDHEFVQTSKLKALVHFALCQASHMHASCDIQYMVQPTEQVVTSKAMTTNDMLLVPFTVVEKIEIMTADAGQSHDPVGTIAIDESEVHKFIIKRPEQQSAKALCMFYRIKHSTDDNVVNCVMDEISIQVPYMASNPTRKTPLKAKVSIPVLKLIKDVPAHTILTQKLMQHDDMKSKKRMVPVLDMPNTGVATHESMGGGKSKKQRS